MGAYKGLLKIGIKNEFQYRFSAVSGCLTQIFWGFMLISLYTAFMQEKIVEGFTISQMATYIWLGQAFFAMKYIMLPKNAGREIVSGNICYKIIKPVNLYDQWFVQLVSEKFVATGLRFLPILLLGAILPANIGLAFPVSFPAFLLFIFTLIIGFFMTIAISMIAVALTFKTMTERGVSTMINVVTAIFCGTMIPLPLMPIGFQNIINYLPFRAIGDLSFRIYMGNLSINDALVQTVVALGWLALIIVIGKIALAKATKKVVVQGG